MGIASTAHAKARDVGVPTPAPEGAIASAGTLRWSPPRGRDLLAGVAVLSVLFAILVVFSSDRGADEPRPGSAQPLARAVPAAATAPAVPDWSAVPVALRAEELGSLSRPVVLGLAAARKRIDRCVAVERRRASPPADVASGAGPAELVLSLAARSAAVHVDGVEVRSPGASAELADCARRHLDGDAFPAAEAVPGRRHRLLVTLR